MVVHCSHHNPTNHHFGQVPTQDNVEQYFWWPKLRDDKPITKKEMTTAATITAEAKKIADIRVEEHPNDS